MNSILENIKLTNKYDILEQQKEFKNRLKNEARGIQMTDRFLNFIINHNNGLISYASEIEMENIRLLTELNKCIDEKNKIKSTAIESIGWLQSLLIKQLIKFKVR